MKRFVIMSLIGCMTVGQITAIEVIPEPGFGDRLSYFAQNIRDFADMRPQAAAATVLALVAGAGYCAASYFDRLPIGIPSVSKVKRAIHKALPEQTPGVIAAEGALVLCAAYLLQDIPAFIGSWFENPFPDGV